MDFHNGQDSCDLEGGPGTPVSAPTKEKINTGAMMIQRNPHLTIRQHAVLLQISIGSVHTLFRNLLNAS